MFNKDQKILPAGAAAAAIAVSVFAPGVAAAETASGSGSASLEEIIVTAAKREQSLSDVGMSITAVTGDALRLRGINSPTDLNMIVPGLTVQATPLASPVYTLRGVGFYEVTLSASPTTAVYLDETVVPFSAETRGITFDMQRVEVLKGPQGTLFGANTTGGAINFIANKPTDKFEAGVDGTFGRFMTTDVTAFVSGPVSDTLKVRVAGRALIGDAWQKSYTRDDKLGDKKQFNGRLIADWAPNDALNLVFTATGWTDKGETQAAQYLSGSCRPGITFGACSLSNPWQQAYQNYPQSPKNSRSADWNGPGTTARNDDILGGRPERDDWFYMLSLRGDYKISDAVTLTSITAYSKYRTDARQDFDGTNRAAADIWSEGRIETISQELRLSGSTDRLNWIVGGNYDKSKTQDSTQYGISEQGGYPFFSDPVQMVSTGSYAYADQDIKNIAAFANVEYKLTDNFTALAGVRYTDTERKFDGCTGDRGDGGGYAEFWTRIFSGFIPGFQSLPGECTVFKANFPEMFRDENIIDTLKEDNLSWTLGLNFNTDAGTLFYGRVSKGYKAGSFPNVQAASLSQYAPVKQESLLAYEVGVKAPFLDNRVNVAAAIFYYDYNDKQLKGRAPDPVFRDLDALVQIPKSKVEGAEIEITARPVAGLNLFAGATYVRSRIKDYLAVQTFGGAELDFAGQAFPYSPKLTIIGDAQYDFPLTGTLDGFVGASITYNSKTSAVLRNRNTATITKDELFDIDAYALLDVRAGVAAQDGRWKAYVWGKNITNKYYWTNVLDNVSTIVRYTGMPATFGVGASYRF
jgi:iron complex outermembrane receptor protein